MGGLRSIKTRRVNRSVLAETWERVQENRANGMSWSDAAKYAAADEVLAIYRPKVAAMLRSAGFEVGDEDDLTLEVIKEAIKARTGLDVGDMSAESIAAAVDVMLAHYVSSELGFDVTTVLNISNLQGQIKEHIMDCVRNNKTSRIVSRKLLDKIRIAAAYTSQGLSSAEHRRVLNVFYQKKYRVHHKQVWYR